MRHYLTILSHEIRALLYNPSTYIAAVDPSLQLTATGPADAQGFATVTLSTAREDDLGEALLRAFTGAGLRVRALSRAHPTLEDVFLAATRRSWDARLPDKKPAAQGDNRAPLPKV